MRSDGHPPHFGVSRQCPWKTSRGWQRVRILTKNPNTRSLSRVPGQGRKVRIHVVSSFPNSGWQGKKKIGYQSFPSLGQLLLSCLSHFVSGSTNCCQLSRGLSQSFFWFSLGVTLGLGRAVFFAPFGGNLLLDPLGVFSCTFSCCSLLPGIFTVCPRWNGQYIQKDFFFFFWVALWSEVSQIGSWYSELRGTFFKGLFP